MVKMRFFGRDGKRKKCSIGRIKKDLKKCYEESRFNGFPIVLKGFFVVDKKNEESLILYDIFLKDEYEDKIQSKKYELRFENLNARFISQKVKSIKSLFSHKFTPFNLNVFIKLFVKTLQTEKIVYRKNTPRNRSENEVVIDSIWEDLEGKVVGAIKGESVKKEFDEKQNLTTETPFEFLKSFNVKLNDEIVEIELDRLSENERVEMLTTSDSYIGKRCKFKKYEIVGNAGFVFEKCI